MALTSVYPLLALWVQISISVPPTIEKPVKSKDLTGFLLFIVKIKVKV